MIQSPPPEVWNWGLRATALIKNGKPQEALPWIERCLRAGAAWALLLRCRAKQALGQNLLAEADVTRAFDLDPECGWIFGLSVGPLRLPEAAEARRLFEANRAFSGEAACYPVHAFIGKLCVMAGFGARGLSHLNQAVLAAPRRAYLYGWRAEARRRLGQMKGAIRDVDYALALEPGQAVAQTTRAALLRLTGKPAEGLAAARRAARLSRAYEAAPLEAARCALALGNGKATLLWLERAAKRSSRLGWMNLAETRHLPPPDPLSLLARPGFSSASWKGRALAWSGEAALARGDCRAAEPLLEEAVALSPGFPWARAWLAEALHALGKRREARRNLQACLRARPGYARSWITLARVHLDEGAPGKALDCCRKALVLEPDWAWALYWRSRAFGALDRLQDALRDIEKALTLDERFEQARLERRRLLRLLA